MNFFNPIDDVKRALFPVSRTLKELINDQECNAVVKVPSNKIAKEMEVPILDSYRKNLEESEIFGLKLEIKSSKDEEGDKTETKKKYIIRKMLDGARNETEILFKDPEKTDEIIFSSLSSEEQSSDFKSSIFLKEL